MVTGRGFTASFRFRLTSGNPHYVCSETQETVVTETGAFGGGCVRARVLSSRGKAFHQLDLRLQKDWLLRRLKASLYLDVQNVYYHDNSEFIEQDANQMASAIDGLRIFPLFGFRVSY